MIRFLPPAGGHLTGGGFLPEGSGFGRWFYYLTLTGLTFSPRVILTPIPVKNNTKEVGGDEQVVPEYLDREFIWRGSRDFIDD